MARVTSLHCDICDKPTTAIVGKLYFSPIAPGKTTFHHSKYTHHADVGTCCQERLLAGFKFRERLTAAQYQDSRRRRSA